MMPWVKCPDFDEYWCNIHKQHTNECECPPVEDWHTDHYADQRIPSQHRKQGRQGQPPHTNDLASKGDGQGTRSETPEEIQRVRPAC